MDRLPTTVMQILAPMQDNTLLDQLADSADRIFTKLDQRMCAIQDCSKISHKKDDLEKAVADLQSQLWEIKMLLHHQPQSSTSVTYNRHQRKWSTSKGRWPDIGLCWYHQTFGIIARKCQAPCKLKKAESNQGN